MEYFSVKLSGLQQTISEEKSICEKLAALKSDINQVGWTLSFQVKSKQNIQKVINQLADNVEGFRSDMRVMQNVLENIHLQYKNTENKLCDKNTIISRIGDWFENTGNNIVINSESNSADWWKLAWDPIGKFGLGGTGISAIGNLITGDKSKLSTWGGLVQTGYDGYKAAKDIDWANAPWKTSTPTNGSTAEWWKKFFGLNADEIFDGAANLKTGGTLTGWSGAKAGWAGGLEKAVDDITPAGVIVSGVVNAFSNVDEHKDAFINAQTTEEKWEVVERGVQEAVLETAIDVGKGVLVGAAVTAGLAAVGVASAPVAAVAAASAVVCWGADVLCQELTGKPVNELISDAILDTKEAVEDFAEETIGKAVDVVKEGASALWDDITSKFSFGW